MVNVSSVDSGIPRNDDRPLLNTWDNGLSYVSVTLFDVYVYRLRN